MVMISPMMPAKTVPALEITTVEMLELDFWICAARLSTLTSTVESLFSNNKYR